MPGQLAQEIETFERHRDELLGQSARKFALVKGDEVVGTFDTEQDAISTGYRMFGNVAFLVRQVLPTDRPLNYVSGLVKL